MDALDWLKPEVVGALVAAFSAVSKFRGGYTLLRIKRTAQFIRLLSANRWRSCHPAMLQLAVEQAFGVLLDDREIRWALERHNPVRVLRDRANEALGCSGGTEKLVLARVPPQLASEPTLSMRVRTERAMRRTVRLDYLAAGINWKADYVARLDADSDTLDLTGWITLINHSRTTFANTPAEVVAGTVSFDEGETQPIVPESPVVRDRCWPIGSFVEPGALRGFAGPVLQRVAGIEEVIVVTGMRMPGGDVLATQRELGDYKLYALPQPTTIAARQSKQVRFLERTAIKYERAYSYTLEDDLLYDDEHTPAPPDIVLRSLNNGRNGLGVPLPAGRVAVMALDGARSLLFAGGEEIQDVPVDQLLEFSPGKSFDVSIEPRVVEPKGRNADAAIEVRLANGSARAAVLEYRHPYSIDGASFELTAASVRPRRDKGDYVWSFRLKPGATKVFRYEFIAD
jgi:hypothetical protein